MTARSRKARDRAGLWIAQDSGKTLGMSSLIGIMMLVGIAASYSTFEQLRPPRRSAT